MSLLLLVWVEPINKIPPAVSQGTVPVNAYCNELYPIGTAQELVRMSRTKFFAWRPANDILTIRGRRLHGCEIVRAFERARGRPDSGSMPPLVEYAKNLLKLEDACIAFQMRPTTLYKLRVAHKIPLLPGKQLHQDDIIAALDAERLGELPLGQPDTVRVVLRRKKRVQKRDLTPRLSS